MDNNKDKKKYFYMGLAAFLAICGGICFYFLLFHAEILVSVIKKIISVVMPVVDGFIIAYLLNPVLNYIENKMLFPAVIRFSKKDSTAFTQKTRNIVRGGAVVLTLLVAVICLYALFSVLIPQLIQSITSIISAFPGYVDNLNRFINNAAADNEEFSAGIMNIYSQYANPLNNWMNNEVLPAVNEMVKTVTSGVVGGAVHFAKSVGNFIIGIIISIYFLLEKEVFALQGKRVVYAIFNKDFADVFVSNVRFVHRTFTGFIGGKIVDSAIVGVICYVVLLILKMPYPMLVSAVVGVTNVIPYFGPFLGAIPSSILILMVNPMQCLYFIIFIIILQQFDGNVLGPKILGSSTGLSSFWVIFAITIFGSLMGVAGMFVGVPIFAVIYAACGTMIKHSLSKKGIVLEDNKSDSAGPGTVWVLGKPKIQKGSDEE